MRCAARFTLQARESNGSLSLLGRLVHRDARQVSSMTNVTDYLHGVGIPFREYSHPPVHNAREAEQAGLPFEPALLTRTLVFRLPERWILVWTRALDRIDYKALSRAAREDRRRIRLASKAELSSVMGWEPGGAAPLPLADGVELIVDIAVPGMATTYIGGGRRDLTIGLDPQALLARVPHSMAPLTSR